MFNNTQNTEVLLDIVIVFPLALLEVFKLSMAFLSFSIGCCL